MAWSNSREHREELQRELRDMRRELEDLKRGLAAKHAAQAREIEALRIKSDTAFDRVFRTFKRDAAEQKADFERKWDGQPHDELGRFDFGKKPKLVSEPAAMATSDADTSPVRVQMAVDERPTYDKADSALLTPKGVNPAGSQQKLKYTLDDDVDYLGGVTVINEDRTIMGRLAPSFGRSIVDVTFDAQVRTADGTSTSSFRIQKELTPGLDYNSVEGFWAPKGTWRSRGYSVECRRTVYGCDHRRTTGPTATLEKHLLVSLVPSYSTPASSVLF